MRSFRHTKQTSKNVADTTFKEKNLEANKSVGVIVKLNNNLPRKALLTLCKTFARTHLDYGDIIYDQPNNESFCNKLETVQYNTALATTKSIHVGADILNLLLLHELFYVFHA